MHHLQQRQQEDIKLIGSLLKPVPDFPKPGIMFQDIFPILKQPRAVSAVISVWATHVRTNYTTPIDVILGLEARGFLFGPMLAQELDAAFAPVRKQGKLPGKCISEKYVKEYGEDVFEMQLDAVLPGQNVLIVDDLLATGGTAKAAGSLVRKAGGTVIANLFVVELTDLHGISQLEDPTYSIVKF